ncbi:MAG: NAD(P)-binding domain-containing protein, partial [Anaerolineae bacterium]|nr:NAD(P)-binding domain-containing protein [Anaerolineae bacterium]
MTQPQQPQRAAEDVLVIGAGPAGIATAYALEQARITYKVVDRANVIGSTWCSLYPSLTLNTSRYYSHMPEAPFPKDYGVFPTGAQYYSYLDDFVKSHDFNIELGVTVHSVTPAGDLWRVET